MLVPPPVIYLLTCAIVGWLGARSPFGFWGCFLGSVLCTPLVAMMILLAITRLTPDEESSED